MALFRLYGGIGSVRTFARQGSLAIAITLVLACGWAAGAKAAGPATVVIPRLGGGIVAAYARLHAAGLLVSLPRGFTFSSAVAPTVAWSVPASGRRVRRGSVIAVYVSTARPRSPRAGGHRRSVLVARFVGGAASAAYSWIRSRKVPLTAYLGPLKAGGAPGLLANYLISRQRPAAGGRLVQGSPRGHPARGASVRVPLTVWAAQPAPGAQTGPVSSVGLTSAGVTGTVTAYATPTTYYFNYGTTRRYGARTRAWTADWSNAAAGVEGTLSGLRPATTYHYRLVAASGAGTTYGADRTLITSGYYQNAIYGAAAVPDPFVLDNGGTHNDYWAFATGNLFPVLHSSDLVHWSPQRPALSSRPAWVTKASDWHPWAPSVLQTSQACPGTTSSSCYVMYYVGLSAALNANCIGVATSPTPGGPYRDQGPLGLDPSTTTGSSSAPPIGCQDTGGKGNIDPSPFIDPSGQAYLYVSTDRTCNGSSCTLKPTISVIPLADDLRHAAGTRVPLFSGDAGTWEAAGVGVPTVEGPAMALHDGVYYLFYSGGSWRGAYGTGYATSTSPTGPFTKASTNPLLAMTPSVRTPGGGDVLVTGPHQRQWLVYAGRDTTYTAPRMLRIDPFSWSAAAGGDSGAAPGAPDAPAVGGPTTTPQPNQP